MSSTKTAKRKATKKATKRGKGPTKRKTAAAAPQNGNGQLPPHYRGKGKKQAKFYDGFIDHFLTQGVNERVLEAINLVNKYVHTGDNVLVVGCGVGHLAARLRPGSDVLAVDLSHACIKWAIDNQEAPGVEFLCADIRTLKDPGRRFDVVVFCDSIEHIPAADRAKVIAKVGKWVKPEKATAVLTWPNPIHHARATMTQFQPVDERVEVDQVVREFREAGFNFCNYTQTFMNGVYVRAVLHRVEEMGTG